MSLSLLNRKQNRPFIQSMQSSESAKIAHLLRRFGLGASESEIEFYGKEGLNGAIDLLLDQGRDEGFDFAPRELGGRAMAVNFRTAQNWWLARMIMTRTPLREKMTLFWHDHFATSAQKVDSPGTMLAQNETLRTNALGKFQTLLTETSKDPAMLYWLDNQLNKVGKPNENFAREIMELFTLGIGNYTEKDIQEAARAFTGWGYVAGRGRRIETLPRQAVRFFFDASEHDSGVKKVLGKVGELSGDDVIAILCQHPQTARYITTKLWEWFAYLNPSDALIDKHAKVFRDSGLNVSALLRSIMKDSEFYSPKATRKLYKNPADFCVATLRQLGAGKLMRERMQQQRDSGEPNAGAAAPAFVANTTMKSMGMELLYPPDVAGWEGGNLWISSATMVERIKWADKLWGTPALPQGTGQATPGALRQNPSLRLPAFSFAREGETATTFVDTLASIFDAPVTPTKLAVIKKAAEDAAKGPLTVRNANAVAVVICRSLFAMPEFQFA